MKRHLFPTALLFSILLSLGACDDSVDNADDSNNNSNDSDDGADGSCTADEPDGNGAFCYEVQEGNDSMKMECELLSQGDWSPDPCDTTRYATQCIQEVEVSEDNEATWETVHYVYYFEAGSSVFCLGEETSL